MADAVPDTLEALHEVRWRLATALTAVVIVIYFGFVLLIAYDKALMGTLITRGLSVGILLGVVVIVSSWLLTWYYVRWANSTYDVRLAELQRKGTST